MLEWVFIPKPRNPREKLQFLYFIVEENEDGVKGVRWQLGGVSFSAFLIASRGLLSDPGTAAYKTPVGEWACGCVRGGEAVPAHSASSAGPHRLRPLGRYTPASASQLQSTPAPRPPAPRPLDPHPQAPRPPAPRRAFHATAAAWCSPTPTPSPRTRTTHGMGRGFGASIAGMTTI